MRAATGRLNTVPFEAFIAWLVLLSGVIGMFHLIPSRDPLDIVLGDGLVTFFNFCYAVSGVLILIGIATGKSWAEGPGIVLLVMSALARLAAILILYGVDRSVVISLAFYAVLVFHCGIRLLSLWRGEILLRTTADGVKVET